MRISLCRLPDVRVMPLVMMNLIRCALVAAIVALPPTAGCARWFRLASSIGAET